MNGGRYVIHRRFSRFIDDTLRFTETLYPCNPLFDRFVSQIITERKKERKGVQLNLITDPLLFFKSITPRYAVFLMLNVEFYNVVFTDY